MFNRLQGHKELGTTFVDQQQQRCFLQMYIALTYCFNIKKLKNPKWSHKSGNICNHRGPHQREARGGSEREALMRAAESRALGLEGGGWAPGGLWEAAAPPP